MANERRPLEPRDAARPVMFCLKVLGYIAAGFCLVALYQCVVP